MKPIDLDKVKAAWQNERGFEDKKLSETDIQQFLGRRSKDISRLFRTGLIFDIVLKSIVGVSLLGIIILFRTDMQALLVGSIGLLLTLSAILYQGLMTGKIPESEGPDPVIRTSLENKINFYRQNYIKSLYVGALSNALLILSGMLYYFYFKYGEIRPFTWIDHLVFVAFILIGYALGAYVQVAQYNFQIRQLESCLLEIDEDALTTYTIRQQRNKKRRLTLLFVLSIVCGLLLLAFLIFN